MGSGRACGRRPQGERKDTVRTVRQQNAGQVRAHQSRIRWAEEELAVLQAEMRASAAHTSQRNAPIDI